MKVLEVIGYRTVVRVVCFASSKVKSYPESGRSQIVDAQSKYTELNERAFTNKW